MPTFIDKVLTRIRGKAEPPEPPIINDGQGNLPSIRILRGPYQVPTRTGSGYGAWGMGYSQLDYQTQAFQGYSRNSDVYSCVSLISEAASQVAWWNGSGVSKSLMPVELLAAATGYARGLAQNTLAKESAAEYSRLCRKAMNPAPSAALLVAAGGSAFVGAWVSSLLISGNSFIEIERAGDGGNTGPIRQLHLLRADRVQAVVNTSGKYEDEAHKVAAWTVHAYGQNRTVLTGNMVHSKLYNPLHDVLGMAPLDAAMLNVLLHNEGTENIRRVLSRGAVPGWIELDSEATWGDTQIAALKEKLRKARGGEDELTLQYAKWHEVGIKPSESGYADAQAISKRDIASVYHVDPVLIGDMAGRTYATYRESRRGLYMEAVIPPLTLLRNDWNRTIGAELTSPLDFDKDSFDAITAAREEATDRVVKLWVNGLIDRSESRADLAYDPVEGDDGVFYAPASFMPMQEPGAPPPPKEPE